jgi:uncharacterized protein (DUF1330 family)
VTVKVIGLIKLLDQAAFELYRNEVGATVEKHQGRILFRGSHLATFWNELPCGSFDACVEIEFPDAEHVSNWANGEDYQRLIAIRSKAMQLTLFSVG